MLLYVILLIRQQLITLARLGGDEFALSAPDIGGENAAEAAEEQLAQAVIERINRPLTLDGQKIMISASLGMVLYPREGQGAYDLLKYADTAMYQAKHMGKISIAFFSRPWRRQPHG